MVFGVGNLKEVFSVKVGAVMSLVSKTWKRYVFFIVATMVRGVCGIKYMETVLFSHVAAEVIIMVYGIESTETVLFFSRSGSGKKALRYR